MTTKRHFQNNFWSFNLGHALTILLLLISGVGVYFKLDQRLIAVELLASDNTRSIQAMDSHGTRASQQGIYAESETSKINERRLTALEATVREMGPKLDRVDVNVQWLTKSLAPLPTPK